MIRIIFFDLDGTLISHTQKAVPPSARRALEKLGERGILRVAATGRHILELPALPVRDICFDGYVTLNGQLCLDAQGNVVWGNPIPGPDREQILRLFDERSIPIMLVEKDAMYCNFINRDVEEAQRAISTAVPGVGVYTGGEIYQANAFLKKGQEGVVMERLSGCRTARWCDYAVDIIPRQGGKAIGIQRYLELYHIRREETAAFGDGENDMEMLRFVHTGVAMGNAEKAVRECADFVTAPVDEDGIEKALLELGVIE